MQVTYGSLLAKTLYPHVAVLGLVLAGHGTLRVAAGTAACSCKYCHEFGINTLKTKTGPSRLSKKVRILRVAPNALLATCYVALRAFVIYAAGI
jgi:hypothetical protein